ncbi:Imm26 family immunity protein [Micromonospora sp. NPDC048842]|uniref:Imm26 family immunity protein n=1 Tax=unclassified Micromonospora TaxID=2617518 RepID=UPI003403C5F4
MRIDLGDGRWAYGRQLWSINAEFYDHVDATGQAADLLELVAKPVAFTTWVTDRCLQRNGRWVLLETVPLLKRERQRLDVKFRQDMFSGALSIASRSHPPSVYFSERPATVEDCEGLEREAIWSPEHIEDRLRDHFDDRPNMWVESLRPKPSRGDRL